MAGDVDPVGDRAGDLAAVVAALHLATAAPADAGVRVEVAARARVGGQHHERAGGEHHRLLAAGDADVAALERLAQRVDDVGAEQRELVEEQHPAVRPADLAGPDPAGAAADEAGGAGVVVRRGVGRADEQPVAGLEGAGERVHRGQLERLVALEVGQQPGDPLGDAGLARALGAGQQQRVRRRRRRPRRRSGCPRAPRGRPGRRRRAARPRARRAAALRTSRPPAAPRAPARRAARRPPGTATAARAPRRPGPSRPPAPAARAPRAGARRAAPRPSSSAARRAPSAARRPG